MKHIKLFESHNQNERIKEELEGYFLELIDDGYRASFSHNHDYSITVFNLYKSKLDFDGTSNPEWRKILQHDTQKIASIQKRILSLGVENLISKIQFHVYTYYRHTESKSTLEPGLIEYSSIMNGDVIYRDMSKKLIELKMDMEDLEINDLIDMQRPLQYYFDIQIQQEIDYGTKDASSVLFKNSL